MNGRIGIWDADKFDRVVEIFTEAANRLVEQYEDGLLSTGVVVKVKDGRVEW
jgi:hypothetical protein